MILAKHLPPHAQRFAVQAFGFNLVRNCPREEVNRHSGRAVIAEKLPLHRNRLAQELFALVPLTRSNPKLVTKVAQCVSGIGVIPKPLPLKLERFAQARFPLTQFLWLSFEQKTHSDKGSSRFRLVA